jgi:23S rRNA (guanosine2251-2'-O)-methyltransferase
MNRLPIYFILEDIYDTYNIGAFFRLAESVGAQKIYLCGETEYPPHPKITKAAKGAEKMMKWEYKKMAEEAIAELERDSIAPPRAGLQNDKDINIIGVEQHKKAIPYTKAKYSFPIAFIFGNECRGIKQSTLKLVNQIVEIPMYGRNKCLNVLSAASVVSYWVINRLVK